MIKRGSTTNDNLGQGQKLHNILREEMYHNFRCDGLTSFKLGGNTEHVECRKR